MNDNEVQIRFWTVVVIVIVALVVVSVLTGGGVPDAITRMAERGT